MSINKSNKSNKLHFVNPDSLIKQIQEKLSYCLLIGQSFYTIKCDEKVTSLIPQRCKCATKQCTRLLRVSLANKLFFFHHHSDIYIYIFIACSLSVSEKKRDY